MMRYQMQPDFVWSNYREQSIVLKYPREIPTYQTMREEEITKGTLFDELATRSTIYGDGYENDSYKIPEANVANLIDYKFNIDKIRKVNIPV